jgi:hypothetical protein
VDKAAETLEVIEISFDGCVNKKWVRLRDLATRVGLFPLKTMVTYINLSDTELRGVPSLALAKNSEVDVMYTGKPKVIEVIFCSSSEMNGHERLSKLFWSAGYVLVPYDWAQKVLAEHAKA